jgi:hypothetical protein
MVPFALFGIYRYVCNCSGFLMLNLCVLTAEVCVPAT